MKIEALGIIGAGQMGSGIAQVSAAAGIDVIIYDLNASSVERMVSSIELNLDRLVAKDKISWQDRDGTLARIVGTTDLAPLAGADFIIEAATEDVRIKQSILQDVGQIRKAECIIASNTSSVSITKLAATLKDAPNFIGMHFFNPVPAMGLVEIIRGIRTSDHAVAVTIEFAKTIGKTPILVNNSPGFVVNRVLVPMINEAIFLLQEGVASKEAIDAAMTMGANHPLGPLKLADLIGLDTCLAIMTVLHRDFGDSKYRPAKLLQEMVDAGQLGRKTSQGFYTYQ
ncbi:3-hydroxybutyryl-CoA dehydrogenase [Glaciimonas sp. PCH181]|uniref:3-hydroxybutyryl-CoA dehydrogenase n=1 Tax=Glaciimonas sp. PCH181 TaxID=2133943 RepID=UPI000D39A315|nr:3-hydroxybutyryl-CoA dehydrogenase [Glaciimonas sp. PCH181]PUA19482.1 3-hydroxybutyryl-CoA dehydrogenase [Glaciimonas sp. PCH181]